MHILSQYLQVDFLYETIMSGKYNLGLHYTTPDPLVNGLKHKDELYSHSAIVLCFLSD